MRDAKTAPRRVDDSPHVYAVQDALDVARYVSDMTAQLEAMAIGARLDLLAYFLGMARAESEMFVRTNASDQDEPDQTESVGLPGMG